MHNFQMRNKTTYNSSYMLIKIHIMFCLLDTKLQSHLCGQPVQKGWQVPLPSIRSPYNLKRLFYHFIAEKLKVHTRDELRVS